MANITAALVNELRKRTGVGMMDCKKALVECDGDMDKAIDYLREKGQKLAAKRADRDAQRSSEGGSGLIGFKIAYFPGQLRLSGILLSRMKFAI